MIIIMIPQDIRQIIISYLSCVELPNFVSKEDKFVYNGNTCNLLFYTFIGYTISTRESPFIK